MQKNENHNKQSLRQQCNQVRTQNSETNSEPYNFMEIEQLALECWLDKQWNEGRNKEVLSNQENEDKTYQNLWEHIKQSLEENI